MCARRFELVRRVEAADVAGNRRFGVVGDYRNGSEMRALCARPFLTFLVARDYVATATRNEALSGALFL